MNLEKAIRLPFLDGVVKVIIGGVLNIIPIVNFLCAGYLVEIMANAIGEKEEMPAWENWGTKFINGLLVFIISLIYMIIPVLIIITGGGLSSITGGGMSLSVILAVITGLAIWFILPMAIANFAATGNFGSAFNFALIFSYICTVLGTYVGIYLVSIAFIFALALVNAIPLMGWIIGILGGFYMGCVMSFLFGGAYRKAAIASGNGPTIGA